MKFYYSGIEEVFNVCHEYINTITIENQKLFSEICKDIYYQIEGNDGRTIVSIDNAPIDIEKNVELITQFIPFELNKKESSKQSYFTCRENGHRSRLL